MKRKVKRYNGEDGSSVEEMKKGLFGPKEDKEEEDTRSTYFKSPRSTSRSTLPSAKEKSGTSYNTEYKEEEIVKSKPKKAAPKASMDAGIPKEDKSTRMPSGYEKLDLTEKTSTSKETTPEKSSGKKYGVGPYGAFSGIHKFISEFKTPAEVRAERSKSSKNMAKGGMARSASSRADGCAVRGKTKGRIV